MATGNHSSPTAPSMTIGPKRRWWPRLLLGALAVTVVALAVFWSTISSYATTGTSYGARVACSCRYAGGRTLSDCAKDFEPGMELVSLSEDAKAKNVTARFALMFSQTATYKEGWGCVLEPWK
ncbi:MAG: hypothetical protein B7X90_10580 [Novosphingobium sp. 17-62-19]|nr:MAG: hypothetical protein B7Y74_04710 [Novosphingobium sp. 35-62-5]OZA18871.1 MAG: hypothetical protein B7X90_10580 [Novosphingobium sp. 17-62-19]